MAMVGVVSSSLYRQTHRLSYLAWLWLGGLSAPNEPGELSKWLYHDQSTINIVLVIINIIISRPCDKQDKLMRARSCRSVP